MTDVSKVQKHCCNNLYFFIPFWLQFMISPKVGSTTCAHPWKFSPLILAQLPSFFRNIWTLTEIYQKIQNLPFIEKRDVHLMLDLSCNRFLLKKAKMLHPFLCFYAKHFFTNLCLSLCLSVTFSFKK